MRLKRPAAPTTTSTLLPSFLLSISPKRLLAYLGGANEDGAVMLPPTVPLETLLFPADASAETVKGRFCIALYIPDRFQVL